MAQRCCPWQSPGNACWRPKECAACSVAADSQTLDHDPLTQLEMRATAGPNSATRAAVRQPLPAAELQARIHQICAAIARLANRPTHRLRQLRQVESGDLETFPAITLLRLGCSLAEPNSRCPRWFAYELVHYHAPAMVRMNGTWLNRFGSGLDSWGDVDAFARYLLGPAWRARSVNDAYVARWARSKDRWRRRAALVATIPLNAPAHGGNGDIPRTLNLCILLLDDRDEMVVKALSWALRELAARAPVAVTDFLEMHRARLAARVQREVRNELKTGVKNPKPRVAIAMTVAPLKKGAAAS